MIYLGTDSEQEISVTQSFKPSAPKYVVEQLAAPPVFRKGPHCKISAVKLDISIASHPTVEQLTGEAIL